MVHPAFKGHSGVAYQLTFHSRLVTIEVSKVFKHDDAEFDAARSNPASGIIKVINRLVYEGRSHASLAR